MTLTHFRFSLLGKRSLETLVDLQLDTGLSLFSLGGGGAEDAVGVGDTGADVLYGPSGYSARGNYAKGQ